VYSSIRFSSAPLESIASTIASRTCFRVAPTINTSGRWLGVLDCGALAHPTTRTAAAVAKINQIFTRNAVGTLFDHNRDLTSHRYYSPCRIARRMPIW
jgi:hypothetical protein